MDRRGCASLAAAAMFNSFAEIDTGTLSNAIERQKFLFNKLSTPLWQTLLQDVETESGVKLEYGFGTFLINNHVSDTLEDENFDAIKAALEEFHEPYEVILPRDVPQFKPAVRMRASQPFT